MTDLPIQSHTAFSVFAFYPFYHEPQSQQKTCCYIKLYLYKWGHQHEIIASYCLCLKLCQKFQDSKIEINEKKSLALFLGGGGVSLVLIRKKTSEEELTTKHPAERCFFHLCLSDLNSFLSLLCLVLIFIYEPMKTFLLCLSFF